MTNDERRTMSDPVELAPSPTLIYGDAEFLKRRAIREYIEAVLDPEDQADAVERVDAASDSLGALQAALGSLPFLSPRKVVVIENFDALTAAQQKELLPALEGGADTVFAVLVARPPEGRAKGPPVSAPVRKLLEAREGLRECRTPYDRELVEWVSAEAQSLGKQLRAATARALLDRCGRDMARLHLELDKLALYVGDRQEITPDDVMLVTSASLEATVFELTDAVGQRNLAAALAALPGLLPAQNPEGMALMILAMLSRQLRLIWQTRFLAEKGHALGRVRELPEDVAKPLPHEHNIMDAVKGRRFLVDKFTGQARGFSEEHLAMAMERVMETDAALKGQTGRRIGGRLALEMLLVDLCYPELAPPVEAAVE